MAKTPPTSTRSTNKPSTGGWAQRSADDGRYIVQRSSKMPSKVASKVLSQKPVTKPARVSDKKAVEIVSDYVARHKP
ncbi:hypothetical protein CK221_16870 [Mesorhizobium sp. WSM3868]|nr:hypothetical protein CK221_16870 [Mesorhizobium sp. WSM3868]